MNDTEKISKGTALVVAASYVCGFVIVHSWYAKLGIVSFQLIDAGLIAAGLLFLSLNAVAGCGWIVAFTMARLRWNPNVTAPKAKAWTRESFIWQMIGILFVSLIILRSGSRFAILGIRL